MFYFCKNHFRTLQIIYPEHKYLSCTDTPDMVPKTYVYHLFWLFVKVYCESAQPSNKITMSIYYQPVFKGLPLLVCSDL